MPKMQLQYKGGVKTKKEGGIRVQIAENRSDEKISNNKA